MASQGRSERSSSSRAVRGVSAGEAAMVEHLYQLVRRRAEAYPTAIALGGQRRLGWKTLDSRQLLDAVDGLADELAAQGVREGDRVVTWLPNEWRTPVYLFALWKLGAIVVPFDREMNPEAAARILASVEPRCVLTGYGARPGWASDDDRVVEWWDPSATGVERDDANPAWSI